MKEESSERDRALNEWKSVVLKRVIRELISFELKSCDITEESKSYRGGMCEGGSGTRGKI
jgi:hypothetical protein